MCNKACLDFGEANLSEKDVKGKRIIEVGARDVNGSLRSIAERHQPAEYIGVDIESGPGVDEVCNVYDLTEKFGRESFDVLICTEMFEHVQDWRRALSEMKGVLRTDGILLITTRSKGFPYHDYPFDYWRFEVDDMKALFSDMKIESLKPDESAPGVLIAARKPFGFTEKDLSDHALYSMVKATRCREIEFSSFDKFRMNLRNSLVNQKLQSVRRKLFAQG
jgi:SAM-dependent methyltransferase